MHQPFLCRCCNLNTSGVTSLTSSAPITGIEAAITSRQPISSSTAYTVVGVSDFNGDGISDVLFRNGSTGDVGFYEMNAGGSFAFIEKNASDRSPRRSSGPALLV